MSINLVHNKFSCILLFIAVVCFSVVTDAQKHLTPPTVQDCPGAIPVCQPIYTTVNSYTGHGNIYPEIRSNGVCPLCMDGEKNDVFYIITVQTDGLLRFKLTPNNITNDYDWELFNMTNAECADIYTNASLLTASCNSYGITGNNGATGINTSLGNNKDCNGPGTLNGPPFNKDLIVHSGQTYILNVSNWSSSQQAGYTLDFGASTAVIFDNVPPIIDSIQNTTECSGTNNLFVRFSENVKCTDVYQHPEKFSLTGSGGPYTISDITSATCATGATQSPSFVFNITPKLFGGSYTLNIIGDVRDLCDNIAIYQGTDFQLTETNAPSANSGNDTTVANGVIIQLTGTATGGTPPYTFHWEPANMLVNPDVQAPTTLNLGASVTFTLTVSDSKGCHAQDDKLVTVVGGPLGINAFAGPSTICSGASTSLHSVASGGTGNYSYSWTSNPPGFTSNIPNPTVYPVVTTVYTVQLTDGFNVSTGNVTVTVNPKPNANPGVDSSIPYGTNALLTGSGSGGSGNYSYYWTSIPPGYSSLLPSPTFVNLTSTTIFTLVVTDVNTGCVSDAKQVVVTVTGSPLATDPVATPSIICKGVSTQLFAMAGGGSGNYTYSWSSVPPGFSSSLKNPVVTPLETTNYNLTLSDGFNEKNGSVIVHVNPVPLIYLGPHDTVICVYDTLILNAGNEGSAFYWSNGATTQTISIETTGIGYDIQKYKVRVVNPYGCMDSTEINAVFSFSACTGIQGKIEGFDFSVYPNPASDLLTVKTNRFTVDGAIVLFDILGREVLQCSFPDKTTRSNQQNINLAGIKRGIYFIRFSTGSQFRMEKIIVR